MPTTPTWERPGTRLLEYAFAVTTPLALFVVLTFLLEEQLEVTWPALFRVSTNILYLVLLAALFGATVIGIRAYRRARPWFLLTPPGYRLGDVSLAMLGWSAAAYVVVGVVMGIATSLLVDRTDHHWPLVVMGFTLFMPAFIAVPAGAVVTWMRLKTEFGAG